MPSGSGFSNCPAAALGPVFPFPARVPRLRPHSSVCIRCRNLNLLPIDYASRPRLRPRLPQGGSALPWKPQIFGRRDSHPPLATHSGILSPSHSTASFDTASSRQACSPTAHILNVNPWLRCRVLGRGASRPVSCYALFECVAASEPTSWLSSKPHILFHLTRTLGP